jgi:hypothetical protein
MAGGGGVMAMDGRGGAAIDGHSGAIAADGYVGLRRTARRPQQVSGEVGYAHPCGVG